APPESVRQLITASETTPPALTATSHSRPGVPLAKPSVAPAGTVTDVAAVISDTAYKPLVGAAVPERNIIHTGSAADRSLPASVLTARVRALPATEATTVPLSMLTPNAAADCARYCGVSVLSAASAPSVPPSASTLPLPSANAARCPAVDEP